MSGARKFPCMLRFLRANLQGMGNTAIAVVRLRRF